MGWSSMLCFLASTGLIRLDCQVATSPYSTTWGVWTRPTMRSLTSLTSGQSSLQVCTWAVVYWYVACDCHGFYLVRVSFDAPWSSLVNWGAVAAPPLRQPMKPRSTDTYNDSKASSTLSLFRGSLGSWSSFGFHQKDSTSLFHEFVRRAYLGQVKAVMTRTPAQKDH